jgi:hypothetical protein
MSHIPPMPPRDEDLLGALAMQFRSTRDPGKRDEIAKTYAQVVERLIRTGHWEEMPSLEDMLPDEYMPASFFEFLGIK